MMIKRTKPLSIVQTLSRVLMPLVCVVFALLVPVRTLADTADAITLNREDNQPFSYAKGMYVILTGDRIVSTQPDDGVLSVTVLIDGQGLQFDMATYTLEHLMDAGIDPKRIDYLFFTHLHADHILGYPEYAFMRSVWGATEPARVFGPIGTGNMVAGARQFNSVHIKALPEFMENVLSEGKNTGAQVEGIRRGFDSEVKEIDGGGVVLETDAFTVTATPVLHSVPSFAFRVDSRYGSVVVSGDTAPSLNVVDLAMNADVLIHEATLSELSGRGMNNIKLSEGLRSDYEKTALAIPQR